MRKRNPNPTPYVHISQGSGGSRSWKCKLILPDQTPLTIPLGLQAPGNELEARYRAVMLQREIDERKELYLTERWLHEECVNIINEKTRIPLPPPPQPDQRTEFKVTADAFFEAWEGSSTIEEVAKKLSMPRVIVYERAKNYRKRIGVKFKEMPRLEWKPLSVPISYHPIYDIDKK